MIITTHADVDHECLSIGVIALTLMVNIFRTKKIGLKSVFVMVSDIW